jgi:cytochrome b561
MPLRNSATRYGAVSQFLHWLIVALLIVQFTLGWTAADLPLGLQRLSLLARHKSFGMTILMLAVIRLAWRFANTVPTLAATLKPYERGLARFTHALLYVLIFAMPVSGWLMSSAANYPVSWFHLFTWPDLIAPNKPLVEDLKEIHEAMSVALVVTISLHVLAALRHHFLLRDDTLKRMLPFARR